MLEGRYRLVRKDDGEEVEVDGLGLAKEFEKDFDPFFSRSEFLYGSSHPLKGAIGDFNFIADG